MYTPQSTKIRNQVEEKLCKWPSIL